jgi:small subunit ribosomal protein S15
MTYSTVARAACVLLLPAVARGFAPAPIGANGRSAARFVAQELTEDEIGDDGALDLIGDLIPDDLPDVGRKVAPVITPLSQVDLTELGRALGGKGGAKLASLGIDADFGEQEAVDLLAGFDLEAIMAELTVTEFPPPDRLVYEIDRAAVMDKYKGDDPGYGSSQVQVASLSTRIKFITASVIANPKDHQSRRGLLALVSKRRRILQYYHTKDPTAAEALAKDLGIRFRFQVRARAYCLCAL